MLRFFKYYRCFPKLSPQKLNFVTETFRQSPKYEVIFLRHAQTEWNSLNLFTGWYDTVLTDTGRLQAEKAGKLLKREGHCFDLVFTSELCRTKATLKIVLKELEQNPEIISSWKLNENHTGSITGLNEDKMEKKVGIEQVNKWRFDFNEILPPMKEDHEHYESIRSRSPVTPPSSESLKIVMKRIVEFWTESIVPEIKKGRKVLIVAHENVFKVLLKHIDSSTPEDFSKVSIPNSLPFSYTFDFHMKPVRNKKAKFFGNSVEEIEEAREMVFGKDYWPTMPVKTEDSCN